MNSSQEFGKDRMSYLRKQVVPSLPPDPKTVEES
jgi:hypothetical protein